MTALMVMYMDSSVRGWLCAYTGSDPKIFLANVPLKNCEKFLILTLCVATMYAHNHTCSHPPVHHSRNRLHMQLCTQSSMHTVIHAHKYAYCCMDVGACELSYYVTKQSAYLKFANMFVKGEVLKSHITFYYSIQDEVFCCFGMRVTLC